MICLASSLALFSHYSISSSHATWKEHLKTPSIIEIGSKNTVKTQIEGKDYTSSKKNI